MNEEMGRDSFFKIFFFKLFSNSTIFEYFGKVNNLYDYLYKKNSKIDIHT